MEEFLRGTLTFVSGFACGCLYTSFKFGRNPNDLVYMAGDDAKAVGAAVATASKKAVDAAKAKFNKNEKSASEMEVVNG